MLNIGSRKQLFIDDRFAQEPRNVVLTVNPPAKAGPVNVEATTAPSIVEHDGARYLYQGLNGATSVWTSADGLDWTPRGQLRGVDDDGPMWTSINSVFADPKDPEYPLKGLYERVPKTRTGQDGTPTQAPVPGGGIVQHVPGIRGRGNHAAHRGMTDDELQEELAPGRAAEFRGPFRQRLALHGGEQPAASERQIDHHGHAAVPGERNDAFAGLAIVERIVDLDDVPVPFTLLTLPMIYPVLIPVAAVSFT